MHKRVPTLCKRVEAWTEYTLIILLAYTHKAQLKHMHPSAEVQRRYNMVSIALVHDVS